MSEAMQCENSSNVFFVHIECSGSGSHRRSSSYTGFK